MRSACLLLVVAASAVPRLASGAESDPGAEAPARQQAEAASEPPGRTEADDPEKKFTVSGYVEALYQYNFNRPGNGISNYRGYDDRHNTLTVQNVVIDVGFRASDLLARVALQVGRVPASMYAEETSAPGAEGAGETTPDLWRHLQRATAGWQASRVVLVEAGIFPASVGVESLAVKENWNWSRTNLSSRLPNYVTGAKATFNLSKQLDVSAMVVNGWNRVVDDNDEKTGIVQAIYRHEDRVTASLAWIGGVEREGGASEGRPFRQTVDAWAQVKILSPLSVGLDSASAARTRVTRFIGTRAPRHTRTCTSSILSGSRCAPIASGKTRLLATARCRARS